MSSFFSANNWGQKLISSSLWQQQNLIDHLVDALRTDRPTTLGAIRFTSSTEQEAEIVLNLGNGANRGTGVMACRFLIDRNRRRQPFDGIHIWLINLTEELPCVGRQTLDVTALTLSKNCVESERALTTATHTRKDHQLIARDGDVDVFEVVLTSTTHSNHIVLSASREL